MGLSFPSLFPTKHTFTLFFLPMEVSQDLPTFVRYLCMIAVLCLRRRQTDIYTGTPLEEAANKLEKRLLGIPQPVVYNY